MVEALEPGDPERMGPYRLTGRLGSGGMGLVFLGRSAGGRPVAVKVIRADLAADPHFRTRFRREVEAARRVNGLYTALVVDADADGPVPWLATAYVSGPSLATAVAVHGPLPADSVVALAAGLAESLAAIHAAGVVHRDLKPSNVLLADDGPRVIDFGISRGVEASVLTGTGSVVGSPAFMSPEQARGYESGPAGDVFSLGGVLTFAATGHAPFGTGEPTSLLYRVVYDEPNLDGVPDEVRSLVQDCLAKDPASRPTTAQILSRIGDIHPGVDWLPGPLLVSIAARKADVPRTATIGNTALPAGPVSYPRTQPAGQHPGVPGPPSRPRRRLWFAAIAAAAAVAAAAGVALALPRGTLPGSGPTGSYSASSPGSPSTPRGNAPTSPSSHHSASHQSSTALAWAKPRDIDGTQSISSVSCASSSFCMAVDGAGDAIRWNGTAWSSPRHIPGSGGLNGVSCPSAGFCAAVTSDGNYFLWHGASWSGPYAMPFNPNNSSSNTYEDIDCVSASFCAAVGGPTGGTCYGCAGYAAIWHASGGWTSLSKKGYVDSLFSVSCAGDGFCLAAGDGVPFLYDESIEWTGGAWSANEIPVTGTSGATSRVSCASRIFCVLVDGNGAAAVWNGAGWLPPIDLLSGGLTWVSCPTASMCAAVTSTGAAVLLDGSTWTHPDSVDPGQAMTSVSCPTSRFCVAVDSAGNAVTYS